MVTFKLVLFFLTALVVLSYLGYGPARLLLRGGLSPFRLLFLPLLGFCGLIVMSSFLNSTLFPMSAATLVLLGLASLVNALLLLKTRTLGLSRPTRVEVAVAALMLLSYSVGVLPLIHANTTAFLGVQWDLELYLPLTEYLKQYAMGGELIAYPNPLIDALNSPPVRGGSGWGFSYVEAFMGTLLGWSSFETFRPMLQLVFSLSVPSVYLFCRWGLRMGAGASLLAAGLTGINGLNLWMVSVGLAGHAVTFVTLPLALAATLSAFRERALLSMLLAGMVVAAMLLSFYTGALPLYGSAAGMLGLVCLLRGPRRAELLKTAAGVAAATILFGLIAHLRFLEVLPLYFSQGFTEGWHVPDFSPVSEALGLTPFSLVAERLTQQGFLVVLASEVIAPWATVLSVGAGLLCIVALLRRDWERGAYLSFLAAFLVLLIYLRWGSNYTYGYFKLLSLAAFLLLTGGAQGLVFLWTWRGRQTEEATMPPEPLQQGHVPRSLSLVGRTALLRGTVLVSSLFFLSLLLANTFLSVRFFWEPDPEELPPSVWELHQLRSLLPDGAPVLVTERSGHDPRLAAMVSYFLMDNPMVGTLQTAYGRLVGHRPDERYQYVLLQQGERPEERGLRAQDLVWQNELVALYRRPQHWLTAVELEGTQQAIPLAAHQELAIKLTPRSWSISNGSEHFQGSLDSPSVRQQVELSLLMFSGSTATLRLGDVEEEVKLPAGLVSYRTGPLQAPTTLELSLQGMQSPAWLLGMRVLRPEQEAPVLLQGKDLLLLQPRLRVKDSLAELELDYRFADSRGGYTTVSFEIYRRIPVAERLQPEGFWQLVQGKDEGGGTAHFRLDLASWQCGTTQPALHSSDVQPPADGTYEAQLAVYYVNEEILRRPLLTFTINAGRVERLRQAPSSPYAISYLPIPRDVRSLAQALPVDAQIYVPPITDPDRSFIPVAVATLKDRSFFTEALGLLPGAALRTPGTVYPYGLLPSREPPERWGFNNAQPLWANEEAILYGNTAGGPLAQFGFLGEPAVAMLAPGESLRGTVDNNGVVVQRSGASYRVSALFPAFKERPQVRITGVAEERTVLAVGLGADTVELGIRPGLFEYWTPSLAVEAGVSISVKSAGPGAIYVTGFEVYQPSIVAPGLRSESRRAYVQASATLVGSKAQVDLRHFGPRSEDALIGVDVYSKRPCELMHYGWWATPVPELPGASEILLDLPRQQGRIQSQAAGLLPLGSETWPIRDGTFRAFLLLKEGTSFETAPLFEFTLEQGQVHAFRSYPVTMFFPVAQ